MTTCLFYCAELRSITTCVWVVRLCKCFEELLHLQPMRRIEAFATQFIYVHARGPIPALSIWCSFSCIPDRQFQTIHVIQQFRKIRFQFLDNRIAHVDPRSVFLTRNQCLRLRLLVFEQLCQ